ncbi:MAG: YiiX/YebB-like N1pC/P60 family cysteine hydrolase [Pseudomonadota bacterium]
MFRWLMRQLGKRVARYLERPAQGYFPLVVNDMAHLKQVMRPGDVLLVEGNLRISSAIKYLTQSTWSHSALYVGQLGDRGHMLIEADMSEGVRAVPLDFYASYNTRVCRPVDLVEEDVSALINYMASRLGHTYDLDNIIDLIRYLMPNPPVPSRWRRGLLEIGSGEPTKAICSTLIAQAFHSIRYPILPRTTHKLYCSIDDRKCAPQAVIRRRHHSLFVPRDFDLSPYFEVIKPTVKVGFDYRKTVWSDH